MAWVAGVLGWVDKHHGLVDAVALAMAALSIFAFVRRHVMSWFSGYFLRRYDRLEFPQRQAKKHLVHPHLTHLSFDRMYRRLLLSGALCNEQPRPVSFRFQSMRVIIQDVVTIVHTSDTGELRGRQAGEFLNYVIPLDDAQMDAILRLEAGRDALTSIVEADFECWIPGNPMAAVPMKQFMWCGMKR